MNSTETYGDYSKRSCMLMQWLQSSKISDLMNSLFRNCVYPDMNADGRALHNKIKCCFYKLLFFTQQNNKYVNLTLYPMMKPKTFDHLEKKGSLSKINWTKFLNSWIKILHIGLTFALDLCLLPITVTQSDTCGFF